MNNNRISKHNIYINSLTISFILLSLSLLLLLSTNVYATHISEPILSLDKDAKYNLNQTIPINGWVKDQVRSDSNGNYT